MQCHVQVKFEIMKYIYMHELKTNVMVFGSMHGVIIATLQEIIIIPGENIL